MKVPKELKNDGFTNRDLQRIFKKSRHFALRTITAWLNMGLIKPDGFRLERRVDGHLAWIPQYRFTGKSSPKKNGGRWVWVNLGNGEAIVAQVAKTYRRAEEALYECKQRGMPPQKIVDINGETIWEGKNGKGMRMR